MMEGLSSSLELDFHKKDTISVRFPTINFLDPQTLHSWVEARKLTLSIGARFTIRMQIYISIYLLLTAFTIGFLFSLGFGFINQDIIGYETTIVIIISISIVTLVLFAILLPTSYINQQTNYQMQRLISLKENYVRVLCDQRILRANPETLDTKFQRIAVRLLRQDTEHLKGEERFKRMEELAEKVFNSLSEAIEELEKDL